MPNNPYQPPGTEKSRWPQFSLRALLIVVAALALLFAQWPFFESTTYVGSFPYTTFQYDGPTKWFWRIAWAELAAITIWIVWRWPRSPWTYVIAAVLVVTLGYVMWQAIVIGRAAAETGVDWTTTIKDLGIANP